ncbi:MAG: helix-turn-helix domain-containing protein [Candidatus Omnitrophica bacterium]|nr:helix-turn-helix domain-containing protein [Candidatus Omnitrophota bacterium]
MEEHLLNIREAAEYLGIGERKVKELADKGEIPAYKIGGTFLRFKKTQLVIIKNTLSENRKKGTAPEEWEVIGAGGNERLRDFLYFNDFYILSIVVILIAVVLMIAA